MFLKIHIYFLSSLVSKEYFDVKEGKPVQIIWNKSSSGEELRGYRLVLNSEIIAYLRKGSLNMTCNEFISFSVIPSAVNTESPGGQNMSDNPQIEGRVSMKN